MRFRLSIPAGSFFVPDYTRKQTLHIPQHANHDTNAHVPRGSKTIGVIEDPKDNAAKMGWKLALGGTSRSQGMKRVSFPIQPCYDDGWLCLGDWIKVQPVVVN
ncbi:MAG TPA: hypothetical protein EYN14_17885 [Alphaproteobacteria bacterium]|nr:hypothetical protein [Alphaproteobacteria bacterium]